MPTYTYADLQADANNEVHGTISDANWLRIINRAVRSTLATVDLRSTKRKMTLASPIVAETYNYEDIADLKGLSIIGLENTLSTGDITTEEFTLLLPEDFARRMTTETGILTVSEEDFTQLLRVSSESDATTSKLKYYSKYLWQNTSGTYLQDSTATTDKINIDADEYEIIVEKCAQMGAQKLDNDKDEQRAREKYNEAVNNYISKYPSEALLISSTYQDV